MIIDTDPSCTGRCTSLLFSVVFRSRLDTPKKRSRSPEEGPSHNVVALLCHMETYNIYHMLLYLTATVGTAGSPSLNNNSVHISER